MVRYAFLALLNPISAVQIITPMILLSFSPSTSFFDLHVSNFCLVYFCYYFLAFLTLVASKISIASSCAPLMSIMLLSL